MGWFLRVGNLVVAKLLQVLFGGPSLTDCGCTLRLTHRRPLAQHARRPHRRRFALPARDGDPGAQARAADHRGAGELPRPRRRVEDHRHADGHAAHRLRDDRADPRVPASHGDLAARRGGSVALAATLPYLPTLDNYFVQDDFGVVCAAGEQAGQLLPALVRDHVDGGHLGLHARRDPAVPRAVATRSPRASAPPRRSPTTSSTSRSTPSTRCWCSPWRSGRRVSAWPRRRWPPWSSCCCRCRPSRWPGSPGAWTRCRRASTSRRSCSTSAGAASGDAATTPGRSPGSRWPCCRSRTR